MEFENVPVTTLFEHMRAVFKSQMDVKEVEFSSEVHEDLPLVRADANKIAWVLSNLVSNALRYVNRGGHVRLRAHERGAHVHVSVQDDGPGIPEKYQTRIFHKFVQVKGQEAGGSGLGLAICKEIVRAHGGTIWVDSAPGQGSTAGLPSRLGAFACWPRTTTGNQPFLAHSTRGVCGLPLNNATAVLFSACLHHNKCRPSAKARKVRWQGPIWCLGALQRTTGLA